MADYMVSYRIGGDPETHRMTAEADNEFDAVAKVVEKAIWEKDLLIKIVGVEEIKNEHTIAE